MALLLALTGTAHPDVERRWKHLLQPEGIAPKISFSEWKYHGPFTFFEDGPVDVDTADEVDCTLAGTIFYAYPWGSLFDKFQFELAFTRFRSLHTTTGQVNHSGKPLWNVSENCSPASEPPDMNETAIAASKDSVLGGWLGVAERARPKGSASGTGWMCSNWLTTLFPGWTFAVAVEWPSGTSNDCTNYDKGIKGWPVPFPSDWPLP